jgi:D-glycero-D-manno-heptose 1,7-bisphosphate phosphatase
MADERRMWEINDEVLRRLARRGARVDRVECCPHHPQGKVARYRRRCRCRKPAPGMLLRAARALGLDVKRSVVIGDDVGDILAGKAIGAATVLLLGGHGRAAAGDPDYATTTLAGAVAWWLNRTST